MPRRLILDTTGDDDFRIIGIATQLKDYRLSFHLNKTLFLDLSKIDDLRAELEGGRIGLFSFYHYGDPGNFLNFYLIGNKSPDGILIPDLRQADYYLLAHGSFSKESLDRFLKEMKKISGVQAVFNIDLKKPKKISSFLEELELHLIAYENKLKKKG